MPYRLRGLSGFSTRASKRRSLLRHKRKARIHANNSSTDSSADGTTSSLGHAETTLTTLFAATSLTRVPSKSFDIVKKMTQKDNSSEATLATSSGTLPASETSSINKDSETRTAEKLSEMHPSAQTEYAALRKQCPDLPEDPGLRAGILLLVTDSGGEVKIGKCDGEPGCETPAKLGSLKRRKKADFGD